MFEATQHFHVKDTADHTPLYHAVNLGKDAVVRFFAKLVMDAQLNCKSSWPWLSNARPARHGPLRPEPYDAAGGRLCDEPPTQRNVQRAPFQLRCLRILRAFGFDLVGNVEARSQTSQGHSALHLAVEQGDLEAVRELIDALEAEKFEEDSELDALRGMDALLNLKNSEHNTALDLAMDAGRVDIAAVLLEADEQRMDFAQHLAADAGALSHGNLSINELARAQREMTARRGRMTRWLRSFAKLVRRDDGALLDKIDAATQRFVLAQLKRLYDGMDTSDAEMAALAAGAGDMCVHRKEPISPGQGLSARGDAETYRDVGDLIEHLHASLGIPMMLKGDTHHGRSKMAHKAARADRALALDSLTPVTP